MFIINSIRIFQSIFETLHLDIFFLFFRMFRPAKNKATDEPVPPRFCRLVKCSLAKMVGAGFLDMNLINQNFWNWFPRKFSNSKAYLRKKNNNVCTNILFLISILLKKLFFFLIQAIRNQKAQPSQGYP